MIKGYVTPEEQHKTYAGEITEFDFCMKYNSLYNVANKIARAESFNNQCRKNLENKVSSFKKGWNF